MINFSVSCPGSMRKPMRVCENKKQNPQNKHVRPYTKTCSPFRIVIRWHKFLLVLTISVGNPGVLGNRLKREEEEESLFTSSSRRRETLKKGRNSGKCPPWTQSIFYLFSGPFERVSCVSQSPWPKYRL